MNTLLKLDEALLLLLNGFHNTFWDPIMSFVTSFFGQILLYSILTGIFSLRLRWKEKFLFVGGAVTSIFVMYLCTYVTKMWVERLRPCNVEALQALLHTPVGCPETFSFFSGHSSGIFALVSFLVSWLRPKGIVVWSTYALAVLVAYTRIYVGVHYPLDIVIGALVGILVGTSIALLGRKLHQRLLPITTSQ